MGETLKNVIISFIVSRLTRVRLSSDHGCFMKAWEKFRSAARSSLDGSPLQEDAEIGLTRKADGFNFVHTHTVPVFCNTNCFIDYIFRFYFCSN